MQASALPDIDDGEMQRRRWLAELATYWHHLLRAVAYTCVEPLAGVRDHALVVMHRCMDVAGEGLKLPHETWGSTWRDILLPMLADLAGRMQARAPRRHPLCTHAQTSHIYPLECMRFLFFCWPLAGASVILVTSVRACASSWSVSPGSPFRRPRSNRLKVYASQAMSSSMFTSR